MRDRDAVSNDIIGPHTKETFDSVSGKDGNWLELLLQSGHGVLVETLATKFAVRHAWDNRVQPCQKGNLDQACAET